MVLDLCFDASEKLGEWARSRGAITETLREKWSACRKDSESFDFEAQIKKAAAHSGPIHPPTTFFL